MTLLLLLSACVLGDVKALEAQLEATNEDVDGLEGDVDGLEDDVDGLEGDVDGLEDDVDDIEAQLEDTGTLDTGALDTGEPPPEPGEVLIDARWDAASRLWSVVVELDGDGDGSVIASYLNIDSREVELTGRCTEFAIDEQWTAAVTFTAEVEWASGAWSCTQLLHADGQPSDGCAQVVTRPSSC